MPIAHEHVFRLGWCVFCGTSEVVRPLITNIKPKALVPSLAKPRPDKAKPKRPSTVGSLTARAKSDEEAEFLRARLATAIRLDLPIQRRLYEKALEVWV